MGAKTELINLIKSLNEEEASKILKELNSKKPKVDDNSENEKEVKAEMSKIFGLWEGRDISLEKLRDKAWRRK